MREFGNVVRPTALLNTSHATTMLRSSRDGDATFLALLGFSGAHRALLGLEGHLTIKQKGHECDKKAKKGHRCRV